LKAEIEKKFPDAEIELIEGSNGVFEVKRDGTLLFSKHELGRFPNPGEIAEKL